VQPNLFQEKQLLSKRLFKRNRKNAIMDNMEASQISPNDMPEGFSTHDPTGAGKSQQGGGKGGGSQQQQQEQKDAILQQALTPEALARLRRIKLVKPPKAAQLENALVNMAVNGKLPGRVSEAKLIEMLERKLAGSAASDSGIRIQRKKYAFDSDDEDDNDDDLM
jgi:programmed cell death protein 5